MIVGRGKAWSAGLAPHGLLSGGEKRTDEGGRHLRLKDGCPLATDGPCVEAHDEIGGIFMIKADSEHATAADCAQTDWPCIVQDCERLLVLDPSAAPRLGHAIALAEGGEPAAARLQLQALQPSVAGGAGGARSGGPGPGP